MTAEMTTTVHVTTPIPGGEAITTPLGTLTVPVKDDKIDLPDLYEALGELLLTAGKYCQVMSGRPSMWVGESRFPE
ncbi:hypothetical protein ACGFZA_31770 [Streptomyces sp. NPDC048211]|uniref:hypothetical protein n=1 Tax=Streptomyces sp. NPDC048211 TaxID=3365516 RepID=UPI0037189AAA